ncbi:MAG TPA: transaldolase [Actinomycetes bacterium]|jgi:transaldolase|nr:transaldolase [Actinomycetes bacterium]
MTSRLQQLTDQGVAVWVDSIARDWIQKGELRRLRDQFQVVGVTSNPTIFQKAMGEGSFYDEDITRLAGQGLDAQAIFESLALDDIRAAAADMEPVWERTGGVDGRISFEVAPDIADDTQATISEARRLFDELARPNVFIKIPATAAGVPAIRASIATGINVNVTLIFSIQRYREVIEAYLGGLEELAEAGGDLTEVASVASFFVSRVDTLVDKELQALVDKGGDQADAARARLGTAAIDNAKLAYEVFEQTIQGARWAELERQGARVQRPLWASTSTKNPDYRDVLYVEELVARDTVDTMPLETIEAFADHGEVRGQTAGEALDRAHRLWSDLAELGIDEAEVGWRLEREGVEKFADSYHGAVETIEAKRTRLGRSPEGRE